MNITVDVAFSFPKEQNTEQHPEREGAFSRTSSRPVRNAWGMPTGLQSKIQIFDGYRQLIFRKFL